MLTLEHEGHNAIELEDILEVLGQLPGHANTPAPVWNECGSPASFWGMNESNRTLQVTESRRVPIDGLVLGWGSMVPFPILAVICWQEGAWADTAGPAAQIWGAALLLFFSGVRRGLSFRTEAGPSWRQLVVFALLFWTGLLVLILPAASALLILAAALAALGLEDVRAAAQGEVPLYFRRLRPPQMAFASASTLLCWWAV